MRVVESYDHYNLFDFSVPVGLQGDCYDRYLIRIFEMRESVSIIKQCLTLIQRLDFFGDRSFVVDDFKFIPPSKSFMKFSMRLLFIILSCILKVLIFLLKKLIA